MEAVKQVEPKSYSSLRFLTFLHRILRNRLVVPDSWYPDLNLVDAYRLCIDLRATSLAPRAREGILDIVSIYLQLTYSVNNPPSQSYGLSLTESILVMLFSMSGRSIYNIPHLQASFGHEMSGPALAKACQGALLVSAEDSPSQNIRVNPVRCILHLRRGSGTRWSPLLFLHCALLAESIEHNPLGRIIGRHLDRTTVLEMATFGTNVFDATGTWIASRVLPLSSIKELLSEELVYAIENYAQSEGTTNMKGNRFSLHSVHTAAIELAVAFLCIHAVSGTYSWWDCCSWINKRQLKNFENGAYVILVAVSRCLTSHLVVLLCASKEYRNMKEVEPKAPISSKTDHLVSSTPDVSSKSWNPFTSSIQDELK
ncbi:hypothetical protein BC629DRAFT_258612 [Irpex lacteus]|nr:hypothetical protein BC629DRAFT_258612 [Irpex lacteus]